MHFPYFYRLVPPDLEESYAMVAIAQQLHYTKIALAFGNDIGSQTFIQPAIAALKKAGMTAATTRPRRSTRQRRRSPPEAEPSSRKSHPDAIMTAARGSADPTLFSEIEQLNGGKMIIGIQDVGGHPPAFFKARRRRSASAFAVGATPKTTW